MSLYQFILNTQISVCCHFYNTYTVYLAHIYSAHVNRRLGFISCVFFSVCRLNLAAGEMFLGT